MKAREEPVEMLTYIPAPGDLNPMFPKKRVCQGSSGDVYPLFREGGKGIVLSQFTEAKIGLGQAALRKYHPGEALSHFEDALNLPVSLSETRHLLAGPTNIYSWLGNAYEAMGNDRDHIKSSQRSDAQRTDFRAIAVHPFSAMTYCCGSARLGTPMSWVKECWILPSNWKCRNRRSSTSPPLLRPCFYSKTISMKGKVADACITVRQRSQHGNKVTRSF